MTREDDEAMMRLLTRPCASIIGSPRQLQAFCPRSGEQLAYLSGTSGSATSSDGVAAPLTIAAAKRGLAVHYGVEPDAIEIVIRG